MIGGIDVVNQVVKGMETLTSRICTTRHVSHIVEPFQEG